MMDFDDAFHNGQTQAVSLSFRAKSPIKTVKNAFALLLCNAGAIVTDIDDNALFFLFDA